MCMHTPKCPKQNTGKQPLHIHFEFFFPVARLKILEVAGNVCGLKGPAIKAEGLSFIPGMHMVEKNHLCSPATIYVPCGGMHASHTQ